MTDDFAEFEYEAEPGDLVSVDGYGERIFQVETLRLTHVKGIDEEYNEVVYEMIDCGNGEWLEADEDDLLLLADACQADEFLRANPAPVTPTMWPFMDLGENSNGGGEMFNKKPEKKLSARELSSREAERRKQARKTRAEAVDNLLDRLNWYKANGSAEDVAEVERELAELVGEKEGER